MDQLAHLNITIDDQYDADVDYGCAGEARVEMARLLLMIAGELLRSDNEEDTVH